MTPAKTVSQSSKAPNTLVYAALSILFGAFCFSVMNAIAKFLPTMEAPTLHVFQLTAARYGFAVLILLPIWLKGSNRALPTLTHRYLVRTLAGFGGIALMFLAVSRMQLAAATAIGFTSPIFGVLIAAFVLRERVSRVAIIATVLGLGSTLIIVSPENFSISSGVFFALAAAICMGGEIVAIKWLSGGKDNNVTILFFSNLFGAVLSLGLVVPFWVTPNSAQMLLLFLIGAIAVTGQIFVLRAARLVDANFLAPFFYVSLVYSAAIGFFVFDEILNFTTAIGCLGIIFSAILMTLKGSSSRQSKPEAAQPVNDTSQENF